MLVQTVTEVLSCARANRAGKEAILKDSLRCDDFARHARFRSHVRPHSSRELRASTIPPVDLRSFWDSGLMGVATHEKGSARRSPNRRYSARFGARPDETTSPRSGRFVFATEQRYRPIRATTQTVCTCFWLKLMRPRSVVRAWCVRAFVARVRARGACLLLWLCTCWCIGVRVRMRSAVYHSARRSAREVFISPMDTPAGRSHAKAFPPVVSPRVPYR